MKKILLIIDYSIESDRELLRGMVRYSKDHGGWLFHKMPSHFEKLTNGWKHVIDWADQWKADAIVGHWPWEEMGSLSSLNIPIVLENHKSRSSFFSNLTGDYFGTGVLAASFFLKKRYKDFAFFGLKGIIWSEERLQGYKEEIESKGGNLHSMMVNDPFEERDEVEKWLHSLPKPVALLACNDEHAFFISNICKVEGIQIPDKIALLGIDNDELLCQIADPQISSIAIKVEQGGYRLGELLDKQFESGNARPFNIVIKPGEIIERNSTRLHNIRDPYVERIVSYIDNNFDQYITLDQVFSQAPLSRRSLEIRFKKEMNGTTVYKYLLWCRMQRFAQLLSTTDYSVQEIAEMCGVLNYPNISRAFKSQFGCTPKEYRRRNKGDKNNRLLR